MNDVSSTLWEVDRVSSFTCRFDGFISRYFRTSLILALLDSDTDSSVSS